MKLMNAPTLLAKTVRTEIKNLYGSHLGSASLAMGLCVCCREFTGEINDEDTSNQLKFLKALADAGIIKNVLWDIYEQLCLYDEELFRFLVDKDRLISTEFRQLISAYPVIDRRHE
jgi:hypothetical protein